MGMSRPARCGREIMCNPGKGCRRRCRGMPGCANAITNTAGNYFTNPLPTTITNQIANAKFGSALAPQLQMIA